MTIDLKNPVSLLFICFILIGSVWLGSRISCDKTNHNDNNKLYSFSTIPNMNRAHELYCYERDLPFDLSSGMEQIIYPHGDSRYQFHFVSKSNGDPIKAKYQLELNGILQPLEFNEGQSLNLKEFVHFPMMKIRVDPIDNAVLLQKYCL